MSLAAIDLSNSAFITDLRPSERSVWRFALALIGGLFAFLLATIVAIVAVLGLYIVLLGWPAPASIASANAFVQRFTDLAASDGRDFGQSLEILGLGLPSNVLPMFAFIGVAAVAQGRGIRGLATSAPRFRWRLMLTGVALSALVIGPFVVAAQAVDPKAAAPPILAVADDPARRLVYLIACLAGFLPAALGEEILFRGWLLRQMSNVTRNGLFLIAFNGVVFAASHLDFAPDAFLERAVMGAGLAYLTLRLGGVELAWGVHAANNLMIVLWVEPLTLKLTPDTGLNPSDILPVIGIFIAYVGIAELTARWPLLRRLSGADQAAGPPATAAAEHFS